MHHVPQNQDAGNPLRHGGRNPHTQRSQPERRHHHNVQSHIDHAGNRKENQRMRGVPVRAQNGGTVVVHHVRRCAGKVGTHIRHRLVQHLRLGPHQRQQRTRQDKTDDRHSHAADQRRQNRGMDGLSRRIVLPRPQLLRYADAGSDRQPEKEIDNQIDQRSAGADRRQRRLTRFGRLPAPASHHHRVGGVEQKLQNSRCDQREREKNNLREQCALCQVAVCPQRAV